MKYTRELLDNYIRFYQKYKDTLGSDNLSIKMCEMIKSLEEAINKDEKLKGLNET